MRMKVGVFSFNRSPAEEIVNGLIARNDVSEIHMLKEDYIKGRNSISDVTKINVHEDYDSLLRKVDVVVAILAKLKDYEILSEALSRGKLALIEGPLALDRDKFEEIAKRRELIYIPRVLDFNPYLKELVNVKRNIGEILSVSILTRVKILDEGSSAELALSALYRSLEAVCAFLETEIRDVVCAEKTKDESLMVLLESSTGTVVSIDVFLTKMISDMKVVVVGSEGSATLDTSKQIFKICTEKETQSEFFGPEVYSNFLEYFFGAVSRGSKPKIDIDYVKRVNEIIFRVRELLKSV